MSSSLPCRRKLPVFFLVCLLRTLFCLSLINLQSDPTASTSISMEAFAFSTNYLPNVLSSQRKSSRAFQHSTRRFFFSSSVSDFFNATQVFQDVFGENRKYAMHFLLKEAMNDDGELKHLLSPSQQELAAKLLDELTSPSLSLNEESQAQDHSNHHLFLNAIMAFDGGSRGNPGPAGAGVDLQLSWITLDSHMRTVESTGKRIFHREFFDIPQTNNQAEYRALNLGLQQISDLLLSEFNECNDQTVSVFIQGDSQLVIRQMTGEYKCKSPLLQPLYSRAQEVMVTLANADVTFQHIRREHNTVADALANEAMDAGQSWITTSSDFSYQVMAPDITHLITTLKHESQASSTDNDDLLKLLDPVTEMDETIEDDSKVDFFPVTSLVFKKELDICMRFAGATKVTSIAGAGVFMSHKNLERNQYLRKCLDETTTNNQANFHAVLEGLKMVCQLVKDHSFVNTNLKIKGDSLLVIKVLKGDWKCKSHNLTPLYEEVQSLIAAIENASPENSTTTTTFEYIRRKSNSVANGLALEAIETRRSCITCDDPRVMASGNVKESCISE